MIQYRMGRKRLGTLAPFAQRTLVDVGPVCAAELAFRLDLAGSREQRRRCVRDVIRFLREEDGERVCANTTAGYWLARNRVNGAGTARPGNAGRGLNMCASGG